MLNKSFVLIKKNVDEVFGITLKEENINEEQATDIKHRAWVVVQWI